MRPIWEMSPDTSARFPTTIGGSLSATRSRSAPTRGVTATDCTVISGMKPAMTGTPPGNSTSATTGASPQAGGPCSQANADAYSEVAGAAGHTSSCSFSLGTQGGASCLSENTLRSGAGLDGSSSTLNNAACAVFGTYFGAAEAASQVPPTSVPINLGGIRKGFQSGEPLPSPGCAKFIQAASAKASYSGSQSRHRQPCGPPGACGR